MKTKTAKTLTLIGLMCGVMGVAAANLASTYFRDFDRTVSRSYPVQTWAPVEGRLYEGEQTEWTVTLRAGQEYLLYGACDSDCSDMDLTLYNAAGDLVASDTKDDDTPRISIRPTRTQTYTLEVNMFACDVEPCDYMLGFRQRY